MDNTPQSTLHFIAVGPQRTGTTWLHEVLKNHPCIGLPVDIKETMFFDRYYHKGNDWLFSHFETYGSNQTLGEIGPSYFGSKVALERIRLDHSNCKIIINVRNPIEHAYSMYLHELSKGRIQGKLQDVIVNNPDKLRTGTYAEWIPLWQAEFGDENVYLVWMDQIKSKPRIVYDLVCDFLGVSNDYYPEVVGNHQVNAAKVSRFPKLTRIGMAVYQLLREYRLHSIIKFCKRVHLDRITFGTGKNPELSPADFCALSNLYSKDIGFLEQISGQDLSIWRKYDS